MMKIIGEGRLSRLDWMPSSPQVFNLPYNEAIFRRELWRARDSLWDYNRAHGYSPSFTPLWFRATRCAGFAGSPASQERALLRRGRPQRPHRDLRAARQIAEHRPP